MSSQESTGGAVNCTRLQLSIWHPNCWTLEATQETKGGLLGHGVHEISGMATGRFTAYAETTETLEELVDDIEKSALTNSVWEVEHHHATDAATPGMGNATRGLVVRYDLNDSIKKALVSRGFIPDEAVRITGGREYWAVVIHEDRNTVASRLEEIREEKSATIDVELVTSLHEGMTNGMFRTDRLSKRQREVFELARSRNYYTWPREVTAGELAADLGISDSTFLEHLRKAEAKLLGVDSET